MKKGEEEYMIVVSGVKDTGLCGKYWSDMETLPSKRRRTTVAEQLKVKKKKVELFCTILKMVTKVI